ncbi:MAG: hypothetical protein KDA80_06880, partial [Planctomycetaceae bacterium]|nr:hypothetical protein [Planctomycetaceae bacterium]
PGTWVERARREGSQVLVGLHDREEMVSQALAPLGELRQVDAGLVADFLALGAIHLQTELLTRHMRNFSQIDEVHMQRELTAAAKAAIHQDEVAAKKHLHHCFEILQECRERFYPVDSYLIDLCLLSPDFVNDKLAALLASSQPTNLYMRGQDWQTAVEKDPAWKDRIREAVQAGTIEILGGEQEELGTTLLALEATLHQLELGRNQLEELFGVKPVTWCRRKFGVGSHLPQILDRLGYTGALHVVLDDGIYPDDEQTNLRWEGSDGSTIPAFSRIPLAADSASSMLRFPVRMSESMDYDHVAAVAFARWPEMKTPFLEDFRRAHAYGPILGKFVTFADFFDTTTSPGRISDFRAGGYLSPTLSFSVARQEPDPISRFIRYWKRYYEFLKTDWILAIGDLIRSRRGNDRRTGLDQMVHAAHPEATKETIESANTTLTETLQEAHSSLVPLLTSKGKEGAGVLVVNPLSFPRRVVIEWPVEGHPPADPCVVRQQRDSNRTLVQLELPPCGFVWLASEKNAVDNTSGGKTSMAEDLILRTDNFEVQMSDVTGGIAKVMTYRRSPNRISQQVALRFANEKTVTVGEGEEQETFKTWYTAMQMRESRTLSEGPLVGEIETLGDLLDESTGNVVATYRQRTRVRRGSNVIDVELELSPSTMPSGSPWTNYIGCRFAWRHEDVAITASMQQGAHAVKMERIEAPQYIELADDAFRTTLLYPGIPFHRKTGERMLDTMLLVEGETARNFQFSIAIDEKYPMQATLDRFSEPVVVPTQSRPAGSSQMGWFFQTGAANVQLTRILESENGTIVRLLETEGRTRTIFLECFKPPTTARQVDFRGQTISTLKVEEGRVQVEVAPYEICDVELQFSV